MCYERLVPFPDGETLLINRNPFPFLYNPAEHIKILESVSQKLLSFFWSDCVNDEVDRSVQILKQTIDE